MDAYDVILKVIKRIIKKEKENVKEESQA